MASLKKKPLLPTGEKANDTVLMIDHVRERHDPCPGANLNTRFSLEWRLDCDMPPLPLSGPAFINCTLSLLFGQGFKEFCHDAPTLCGTSNALNVGSQEAKLLVERLIVARVVVVSLDTRQT